MSIDFDKIPQYDAVIGTLLEKTKEGKLTWKETADPDTFLAAVRGKQTFEIQRVEARDIELRLTVRDTVGDVFFEAILDMEPPRRQLFDLAKRLATRVDEKIEASVQLLAEL